MKVVLPEPAMPTHTMATGGFCSVVAMMESLVVEVVLLRVFEICWILGRSPSRVVQQASSRYLCILSDSSFSQMLLSLSSLARENEVTSQENPKAKA
jgi:hypothetical protein